MMGKELGVNADLLHSQEGILKNLGGGNGGGEGVNRSGGVCSQCSHRHPPRTMREPHNGQNPVHQEIMGGSD
jgi:hypothetical protein